MKTLLSARIAPSRYLQGLTDIFEVLFEIFIDLPEVLADETIQGTADNFSPFSEPISRYFNIEP